MEVTLMIPCYINVFRTRVGIATLESLECLGVNVVYPKRGRRAAPTGGKQRLPVHGKSVIVISLNRRAPFRATNSSGGHHRWLRRTVSHCCEATLIFTSR
jgi:hypothetical protein